MKKIVAGVMGLFLVLAVTGLCMAADEDRKGSQDHPLLSRMPDFHISDYENIEFASQKFIDQDKKPVMVEGHKYVIRYRLNAGVAEPGELKIRRNIQEALKKIGGQVIFDDNFNRTSTIVVKKDDKETWVDVRSFNNMYLLTIVEKAIMKQEVVANAEAMAGGINTTGHVAVYGIYFDTGKSEIKPESEAAIGEIAKLLAANAAWKIYVVGHTDNVGSLDANMKLSRDRADAVVKALTGKHGIAAARLQAHGVASLCPVASNDTGEGKARNRRVELVKQ